MRVTGVRSQTCHGEWNKIIDLVRVTGVRSQSLSWWMEQDQRPCEGDGGTITVLVMVDGTRS